ncbi:MAG: hypothetical protein ABJB12_11830 [Pseudomonadota bacterium]
MKNRANLALLCGMAVLTALPAQAQSHGLIQAERSYQDVDFPATHLQALRALQAGGATRSETARLYVLLGISAAALDNAEEAKQDFVVALAANPELKLESSLSPKLRSPYLEAQGYWSAASARLSITAKLGTDATHLIVRLVDPASLVTKVELQTAAPGATPRASFELVAAPVTRFPLPRSVRDRDYEYALRALDGYGNVLAEYGADADPILVRQPLTRAPTASSARAVAPRRSYFWPVTLGVMGFSALAGGVVFNVKRERAAHEWNGPGCETAGLSRLDQCAAVSHRVQTDERLSVAFYAGGGALLTAGVIALFAGGSHEATPLRTGLVSCAVSGPGVSCLSQF